MRLYSLLNCTRISISTKPRGRQPDSGPPRFKRGKYTQALAGCQMWAFAVASNGQAETLFDTSLRVG